MYFVILYHLNASYHLKNTKKEIQDKIPNILFFTPSEKVFFINQREFLHSVYCIKYICILNDFEVEYMSSRLFVI